MLPVEETLESWNLMTSYKNHEVELVNIATATCLSLCSTYKVSGLNPPSFSECQELFCKVLRVHPLFWDTISRKEHPYVLPGWYDTFAEYLGRYVVQLHWTTITSRACL